jgi:hypothetical protein
VTTSTDRYAGRTFSGLLRALVPGVLLLLLIVWWQRGEPTPVQTVDAAAEISYAQRVSPVPLPAPAGLPADWRPTSARVEAPAGEKKPPVTLTIGYLTPAGKYAQVTIGDRDAAILRREVTPGAVPDGTVRVGEATWERSKAERDEPVLAGTVGKAGVVVTGDASPEDLARLASSVR